jgi:hypothetical protein
MQTIADSSAPVKTARRQPYTWQDLQDAAAMFGELEDNRQLDELALQAAWDDQFNASIAAGHCLNCGDHADLTSQGLCDRCDSLATDATIACQNKAAMGQYRVF